MTLLNPAPPDPVEGALGHFDHTLWVKESLFALDLALQKPLGGLFSLDVVLDPPDKEDANLVLQGNANRSIWSRNAAAVARWRMLLGDNTAETGADSGALFKLNSYTDGGVAKDTVLEADRANGLVKVKGAPTADNGVATKKYVDDSMPIGAIIAYGGNTAPAGWHLCNGTAHGSSALQAILGSANAPDLRDRFIVGAGSSYSRGSTGGAATVTLTGAQSGIPSHAHTASSASASTSHNHGASTNAMGSHSHGGATGWMDRNWSHSHTATIREGITSGDSSHYLDTADEQPEHPPITTAVVISATDTNHLHGIAADGSHGHTVTVNTASATHTHGITVDAAIAQNASQPHENRPPYYALTYIIKKV